MRTISCQLSLLVAFGLVALTRAAAADDNPSFHFQPHHVAPLDALNEVIALVGDTDQPLVLPEELETFKKIAAGQASKCDEADAVLVASGVADKATREIYIAKIKKITDISRKVVALRDTPEKKVDLLAMYLLASQFKSGFKDDQINIRTLLDEHKCNCVSSCVLFNLVGNQLGLKTRAVSVPGHVFLRMGDLMIEPESGETSTASAHQKSVDDRWEKADNHWKQVFGNTRSYESGNLGLVSEIYLDDSVAHLNEKQYETAVAIVLKAACLDPKHPAVAYQLEKDLRVWFADTLKQKNYDKAQKIAGIYGQLFGDDSNKLFKQVAAARKTGQAAKN